MKYVPLNLIPTLVVPLLMAVSQSIAQTPQHDNRPRTASISGRVTVAGKPAANAVITLVETVSSPNAIDSLASFQAKTRTDGDGRYTITGLAEGRYHVSAQMKAFVDADSSTDSRLSRTLNLDEGEARETVDFGLIRGGVMTGKVIDDEGSPLIAQHVQLYTIDDQGQKRAYRISYMYEMPETDDRGVYRIYGLPPGRYIVSAGGGGGGDPIHFASGKFARTYHPDTTDEKQARVIEIKEGSEVTDVDIRFGSARKTYEAAGRVVDGDTGKPVPGIYISCKSKPEKDAPNIGYSTTTSADAQGNFRLHGLLPGRYQAGITDFQSETAYTGEDTEFEITNDKVSGVEVKVSPGASVSGVVVIDGAVAASQNQLQSISVYPAVSPASARYFAPQYRANGTVNADGTFTVKGLQTGRVTFRLRSLSGVLPIKRIERNGIEIKDAIEVRPGEKITGIRIVIYQAQGRIRGQIQITGGSTPDWRRLVARAERPATADESNPSDRIPVAIGRMGGSALIDEKGRFVIEGLPAGGYDLYINLIKDTADGDRELVNPPWSNQRVTVRENEETSVKITLRW